MGYREWLKVHLFLALLIENWTVMSPHVVDATPMHRAKVWKCWLFEIIWNSEDWNKNGRCISLNVDFAHNHDRIPLSIELARIHGLQAGLVCQNHNNNSNVSVVDGYTFMTRAPPPGGDGGTCLTQYSNFLTLCLWVLHGKNGLQTAFVPPPQPSGRDGALGLWAELSPTDSGWSIVVR